MTDSERMKELEVKVEKIQNGSFSTAFLLALLPVCFGLYQFHLSNDISREENQNRALLAALKGETPSEICGNLSLLVAGGLVTDERLKATMDLIERIAQSDRENLDGGLDEFACLPRIVSQPTEVVSTAAAAPTVPLSARIAAQRECAFDRVELKFTSTHSQPTVAKIEDFLESQEIAFSTSKVKANESEVRAYSGLIWYYYPEARRCAQSILDGLREKTLILNFATILVQGFHPICQ